jgi:enoyl-CoA hydratase/carnithine racemase
VVSSSIGPVTTTSPTPGTTDPSHTDTAPVTADARDGVGVLTLARPRQRNPLSVATMTAFTALLRELAASPDVRAIVVRADGPAFSAGHDLREMVGRSLDDEREVFAVCTEMMATVQDVPQPVIAAVQGVAVAAGCQLVATCDLAVAASTAVFGAPGVRIGLFCSTPMVAVSRAIGRKRALQLLLTGDVIDAATAADWGLINEVVAPGEVDARAFALAARIAEASPLTLRIGKQAFYRQIDLPQEQAYAEMAEIMATNAVTCDAQEGMQAFLAKRAPVWEGR